VKRSRGDRAVPGRLILPVCGVCGEERQAGQVWFLLVESPSEDKLRVLQWQEGLAGREGVHRACSPAHVQELVTHWMTMGTLDYPFADVGLRPNQTLPMLGSLRVIQEPDTCGIRELGELSVHRESLGRVLEESPESLQIILDELSDALLREIAGASARFESPPRLSSGCLRQM
jgi:hypothetical protein